VCIAACALESIDHGLEHDITIVTEPSVHGERIASLLAAEKLSPASGGDWVAPSLVARALRLLAWSRERRASRLERLTYQSDGWVAH
jgi:hypothetical protein